MRRYLLPLLVAATLLLVASIGFSTHYAQQGLNARQSQEMTEAQFTRFLADQQHINGLDLFPALPGQRDAGDVLNRYVSLDIDASYGFKADETPWWVTAANQASATCPSTPDRLKFIHCLETLPDGDLSFLANLSNYDTWNPASSGAYQRYLQNIPPDTHTWTVALPQLMPWLWLARFRLTQGLKQNDILPALREIRQLARLTWSTESFLAAMVASSMLSIEREFYTEAVARGQIPPEAWTPVSHDDTESIKNILFATQLLYMGLGPPDAIHRLQAAIPTPVGFCPATAEAAAQMRLIRGLYTNTWPGEIDLSSRLHPLNEVMTNPRCRYTFIGDVWKDPAQDLDVFEGTNMSADDRYLKMLAYLPWVRQSIGAILLQITMPQMNLYQ